MPQTITNPELIELVQKNVAEMKAINVRQDELEKAILVELNPRIDALNEENKKFIALMDAEYGLGNWQNFNVEDNTFIPRGEFNGEWYLIQNPSLRETVKVDDIEVSEPVLKDEDLPQIIEAIEGLPELSEQEVNNIVFGNKEITNEETNRIPECTEINSEERGSESESGGCDSSISHTQSQSSSEGGESIVEESANA